ncbi:MAG: ferrous iron transport protein B [Bacteroidales bacterium]|jgi:ferrous iron transport protein B|nr:ferrous iron transport protein B [Bacteroidales bacterium]
MAKLSELNTGEKGVIVKIQGHGGFRKRIIEMGFIQGKIVEVLHKAPLQDPVEYQILGYHVSLRLSEASQIEVISVEEAEHLAREHNPRTGNFMPTCIGCSESSCRFRDSVAKATEEEDALYRGAREKSKEITVALVGNPNCGKTSLFNRASGSHQRVGNYSGVTVDAVRGKMYYKGYRITLIDLPGTYSISAYSPEEKYVRHTIIHDKPDVILNVVDSSNLERNLFLTTQLIDMNLKMVIALNMYDELEEKGDVLDYGELERLLGVPMVPTVSVKNRGIATLFDTIIDVYEENESVSGIIKHIHVNHGPVIEKSISRIREEIYKNPNATDEFTPRYVAIRILQRDKEIEKVLDNFSNKDEILRVRDGEALAIEKELHDSPENAIMDAKYGFIDGALRETYRRGERKPGKTLTEKIDNIVTGRWLGFPIFLIAMYLIFQATFTLGQYPMDWIDSGVGWLGERVGSAMSDGWFKALVVDGIITGVGGVLVFLPNILILFFFISLMEASGYMARAAFIMDRLMHLIGLHGRSFIPLMMGFGCNVPAVMATRTIENRNARMITILINPLMSCNARLPIYLLLAGVFFPKSAGLVIFCIYLGGVLLAGLMAKLFSKVLFNSDETPFVMELPPYRIPTLKSLLRDTWDKGKQYLHKIATVILIGTLIVWALSYFPSCDPDPAARLEHSWLAAIGNFISPVLAPLGFHWQESVSLLSGMAAKEIVVSTMNMLYTVDGQLIISNVLTPAIALAFMAFTLIYFPCVATIGAIKTETGSWKWALFTVCYTLVLAWIVAFIVSKSFAFL